MPKEIEPMSQTITIENKEKSAQLIWTGFILGFFIIQAIIWTVAISITSRDRSHAVVAGYDEKALKWDDQKALASASASLGWKAEIVVDAKADIRGNHVLTIKLKDKTDSPIAGAAMELQAFHRAVASERQPIELRESESGIYTGQIQIQKSGLWQFEGFARRGDETFLVDQRVHLGVSK